MAHILGGEMNGTNGINRHKVTKRAEAYRHKRHTPLIGCAMCAACAPPWPALS